MCLLFHNPQILAIKTITTRLKLHVTFLADSLGYHFFMTNRRLTFHTAVSHYQSIRLDTCRGVSQLPTVYYCILMEDIAS